MRKKQQRKQQRKQQIVVHYAPAGRLETACGLRQEALPKRKAVSP